MPSERASTELAYAVLRELLQGTVTLERLRDRLKDSGPHHHETLRRSCKALANAGLCHRTVSGAWELSVPIPHRDRLVGGSQALTLALTSVHRQTRRTVLVHGSRPLDGRRSCLGALPCTEYLRALVRSGPSAKDAALLTDSPMTSRDAPGAVIAAHSHRADGPRLVRVRQQGWAHTPVDPVGWWALSVPIVAPDARPLGGALSILSPKKLHSGEGAYLRRVLTIAADHAGHALSVRALARTV